MIQEGLPMSVVSCFYDIKTLQQARLWPVHLVYQVQHRCLRGRRQLRPYGLSLEALLRSGRKEREYILCIIPGLSSTIYYSRTVSSQSQLLFSFGTFDSFLAGLGRNRVYNVCGPAEWHLHQFKPVQQNRKQALRAYCCNIPRTRNYNPLLI